MAIAVILFTLVCFIFPSADPKQRTLELVAAFETIIAQFGHAHVSLSATQTMPRVIINQTFSLRQNISDLWHMSAWGLRVLCVLIAA